MNVTLGVPRLRELLMVASINVKTPTMEVPILQSASALRKAKRLQRRWSRLLFSQVFTDLTIHEKLSLKLNDHKRTYTIKFQFDDKYGKKQLNEIIRSFETHFIPRLCRAINKKRKELTTSGLLRSAHIRDKVTINDAGEKDDQQEPAEKDDDDEDDDEPANGEANVAKEKANRNDEKEYDDDDDEGDEKEADEDDRMHDDNDQLDASKVAIKEDMIDDDDNGQGRDRSKISRSSMNYPSAIALDLIKDEMDNDDEQEVPGNADDDADNGEPPSKKAKKNGTSAAESTVYNERFGVSLSQHRPWKSLAFISERV